MLVVLFKIKVSPFNKLYKLINHSGKKDSSSYIVKMN